VEIWRVEGLDRKTGIRGQGTVDSKGKDRAWGRFCRVPGKELWDER